MKSRTAIIIILSLCIIPLLLSTFILAGQINPAFHELRNRLEQDGMNKKHLNALFTHPELKLMYNVVARSLVRREAKLNYSRFLSKNSVNRGVSYLKTHDRTLKQVESRFGISAPVLVAILSVETACGTYTGNFKTVNILLTQAVAFQPEIYRRIWKQIPSKQKSTTTSKGIKTRLKRKTARAYRELKALLIYAQEQNIDPFHIKGSTEGAIGLPQFLPSNIKHYGSDGNGDNKIDLFQHDDAIASVASYLKAHRWKEDDTYQQKKKVILTYNYSTYYANTVLQLAAKLSRYWN
jgi:membrane-bound lytic murein transglycosylase B